MTSTMVKNELESLGIEFQAEFNRRYNKKSKSKIIAYLLWIIGFHYLYLGKYITCLIFWMTLGGLGFWYFIDIFRVWSMVNSYNEDVELELMSKLSIINQNKR